MSSTSLSSGKSVTSSGSGSGSASPAPTSERGNTRSSSRVSSLPSSDPSLSRPFLSESSAMSSLESPTPSSPPSATASLARNRGTLVASVAGSVAGAVLVALLIALCIVLRRRRRRNGTRPASPNTLFLMRERSKDEEQHLPSSDSSTPSHPTTISWPTATRPRSMARASVASLASGKPPHYTLRARTDSVISANAGPGIGFDFAAHAAWQEAQERLQGDQPEGDEGAQEIQVVPKTHIIPPTPTRSSHFVTGPQTDVGAGYLAPDRAESFRYSTASTVPSMYSVESASATTEGRITGSGVGSSRGERSDADAEWVRSDAEEGDYGVETRSYDGEEWIGEDDERLDGYPRTPPGVTPSASRSPSVLAGASASVPVREQPTNRPRGRSHASMPSDSDVSFTTVRARDAQKKKSADWTAMPLP